MVDFPVWDRIAVVMSLIDDQNVSKLFYLLRNLIIQNEISEYKFYNLFISKNKLK
jgi:hypothetical protein